MKKFNQEEYGQILSLLNGEIDETEKQELLAKIESDPEWAHEVKRVRETFSALRRNHVKSLIERGYVPITPLWQRPQTWLAAASVSFLLGFGIWFTVEQFSANGDNRFSNNQNPPPDSLPQNNPALPEFSAADGAAYHIAQVPQLEAVPRKLTDQATAIGVDVQRQQAIAELQKMKPSGPTDPSDGPLYGSGQEGTTSGKTLSAQEESYRQLLLGIGYLKEKKDQEALRALNLVKDKSLAQEAHWYKALAYLQTNQNAPARRELEKITDSRYLTDATELLKKLQ